MLVNLVFGIKHLYGLIKNNIEQQIKKNPLHHCTTDFSTAQAKIYRQNANKQMI